VPTEECERQESVTSHSGGKSPLERLTAEDRWLEELGSEKRRLAR
jgi:hypothetical protein